MPAVVSEYEFTRWIDDRKTPVIHPQSIIGAKPICIIRMAGFQRFTRIWIPTGWAEHFLSWVLWAI